MSGGGHKKLETNISLMAIFIIIAISLGGLVEIVPLIFLDEVNEPSEGVVPYPALELAGRDVYVHEGCYNCHSQMIRPFRSETERYGPYSIAFTIVLSNGAPSVPGLTWPGWVDATVMNGITFT